MRIFISPGHVKGGERTMTITLRGNDDDFIGLIDEGSGLSGHLGNLAAQVGTHTGLVADRSDDRAQAARLLRRAAEVLDRGND
jgi:hypothetical protein